MGIILGMLSSVTGINCHKIGIWSFSLILSRCTVWLSEVDGDSGGSVLWWVHIEYPSASLAKMAQGSSPVMVYWVVFFVVT